MSIDSQNALKILVAAVCACINGGNDHLAFAAVIGQRPLLIDECVRS